MDFGGIEGQVTCRIEQLHSNLSKNDRARDTIT